MGHGPPGGRAAAARPAGVHLYPRPLLRRVVRPRHEPAAEPAARVLGGVRVRSADVRVAGHGQWIGAGVSRLADVRRTPTARPLRRPGPRLAPTDPFPAPIRGG